MTEIDLTEAERNESLIRELCKDMKLHFLELGILLAHNQDFALWSEHWDSFKDFIETLGIGEYSWVTRLIRLGRVVAQQLLTREEIYEMGVSKGSLLLPLVEKGKLDEETKSLALVSTFKDLREHLGQNVGHTETGEYLLCPRCGVEIDVLKGMVKKR